MHPDKRFVRLFIVLFLLLGLVVGRILFNKKAKVYTRPSGYTEQIEGLDGTPTR